MADLKTTSDTSSPPASAATMPTGCWTIPPVYRAALPKGFAALAAVLLPQRQMPSSPAGADTCGLLGPEPDIFAPFLVVARPGTRPAQADLEFQAHAASAEAFPSDALDQSHTDRQPRTAYVLLPLERAIPDLATHLIPAFEGDVLAVLPSFSALIDPGSGAILNRVADERTELPDPLRRAGPELLAMIDEMIALDAAAIIELRADGIEPTPQALDLHARMTALAARARGQA